MTIRTLKQLRKVIKDEAYFVDIKPYSHNIIGLCLLEISKRFGQAEANKAIVDCELEDLGWSQIKIGEKENDTTEP